jgi:hypothetical protein
MQEPLPGIDASSLNHLITNDKVQEITQLRHPDPALAAKLELQDEGLQIRGSWRKVNLKKPGGMTPRMGFAAFVWNGMVAFSSIELIAVRVLHLVTRVLLRCGG